MHQISLVKDTNLSAKTHHNIIFKISTIILRLVFNSCFNKQTLGVVLHMILFFSVVSPVMPGSEVGFDLTGLKSLLGGGGLEVVYLSLIHI